MLSWYLCWRQSAQTKIIRSRMRRKPKWCTQSKINYYGSSIKYAEWGLNRPISPWILPSFLAISIHMIQWYTGGLWEGWRQIALYKYCSPSPSRSQRVQLFSGGNTPRYHFPQLHRISLGICVTSVSSPRVWVHLQAQDHVLCVVNVLKINLSR